jgi:hypothetical protein
VEETVTSLRRIRRGNGIGRRLHRHRDLMKKKALTRVWERISLRELLSSRFKETVEVPSGLTRAGATFECLVALGFHAIKSNFRPPTPYLSR